MLVFKAAAGAGLVLVLVASGMAQPTSHSQLHSHYSDASHPRTTKIQNGKGLPHSTVAPSSRSAASMGSVKTHGSEIDRLERQSSQQLAAERKHEVMHAATPSHVAHSEPSSRGSSINFAYHSPQRVKTGGSSGSGSRKP